MSEEPGSFPNIDEVLDELKSNGTFDLFRKSCLASVQAEPSFRAYGEHVEVVSRRYLQNFKWRESTTKNEVRTRLKDHALRVIESPDIQVGVPFASLVERAMETQGKELLPKIGEVVNALRQAKRIPAHESDSSAVAKKEVGEESSLQKTGLEFDLMLPIDLPGLKSSDSKRDSVKRDLAPLKKEPTLGESTTKSAKIKPKQTDMRGASKPKSDSKPQNENTKDTNRKEVSQKPPQPVDGKKDSKLKSMKFKKSKDEPLDTSIHSHGKQKELAPLSGIAVSEKLKELNDTSKRDKVAIGLTPKLEQKKESGAINRKEKFGSEGMGEKIEPTHSNRKDDSISGRLETGEKHAPVADETQVSPKETCSGQSSSSSNFKQNDESKMGFILLEIDGVKREEQNTKPLPSRRRSARLGSFSDDQTIDESCQDEEEAVKVEHFSKKTDRAKIPKTSGSRSRRFGGSSFRGHRRGVAHLDSSSEDEYVERSSRSAEKFGVEADEERCTSSKIFGHRKRSLKLDHDSFRSGSHTKRARTLSRTGSPASTGSSASSTMNHEGQGQQQKMLKDAKYFKQSTKFFRGTSKSRSPTPVVVTRFNRHVKPNRRYYASDEEPMDEGDSSEDQQPQQRGKHSKHYAKDKRS